MSPTFNEEPRSYVDQLNYAVAVDENELELQEYLDEAIKNGAFRSTEWNF